jgi:hypothetical protein
VDEHIYWRLTMHETISPVVVLFGTLHCLACSRICICLVHDAWKIQEASGYDLRLPMPCSLTANCAGKPSCTLFSLCCTHSAARKGSVLRSAGLQYSHWSLRRYETIFVEKRETTSHSEAYANGLFATSFLECLDRRRIPPSPV